MEHKNIDEYMLLDKGTRQSHLRLNEPCLLIGADSRQCRALLAYVVKTTIPKGMQVYCCHACNNGDCSNPNHLYWGTAQENRSDSADKINEAVRKSSLNGRKRLHDWIWVNNGVDNKYVKLCEIPEGYHKGRLMRV